MYTWTLPKPVLLRPENRRKTFAVTSQSITRLSTRHMFVIIGQEEFRQEITDPGHMSFSAWWTTWYRPYSSNRHDTLRGFHVIYWPYTENHILAGYPASLGPLPLSSSLHICYPPSLGLPGFAHNICSVIVIAQDNCIPEILFKTLCLVTLKCSPLNSIHAWDGVGVRANIKYQYFRQFVKCPRH